MDGLCGGIASDGALLVGGVRVWAGEAHVNFPSPKTGEAERGIPGFVIWNRKQEQKDDIKST